MNDRNHDHFREATKKVDYIDRNEAIEAIRNDALDLVYYGKKEAIECLESVSAADVRPVAYGEWASLGGDEWCCTNCGHVISTEGSWERPCKKYCEECGADMRGKADATP